jgi:hypothetical protein
MKSEFHYIEEDMNIDAMLEETVNQIIERVHIEDELDKFNTKGVGNGQTD